MSAVATEPLEVTRQTLRGVFVHTNGLMGLNRDLLGALMVPQVFGNSISDGQQGVEKQGLNSAAVFTMMVHRATFVLFFKVNDFQSRL